jgi:hypothetical protein
MEVILVPAKDNLDIICIIVEKYASRQQHFGLALLLFRVQYEYNIKNRPTNPLNLYRKNR